MPLRYLFVDMNSFFASVEQQENPALRGRPVAVVPVQARTTCCIAASYEAKRLGVTTGTPVWEALAKCPDLALVVARPRVYVTYHHRILDAVSRCLPITQVMSVDEFACALRGADRHPEQALALARSIKAAIRQQVGEFTRCSIGIGPNVMLAKVAGDMHKPDGLTMLRPEDLPQNLFGLSVEDFPGIGPRMARRFLRAGVATVPDLVALSLKQMCDVWGSRVLGERWYLLLRGEDLPEKRTVRRTLGHEHVLPPELRTEAGAYGVLVRLVHKAAARLRSEGYYAAAVAINLRLDDGRYWHNHCRIPACQDTPALLRTVAALWTRHPRQACPLKVGVRFAELRPARAATPSLFPEDRQDQALSHVLDQVNRQFGASTLYFGSMFGMGQHAPTRVPFNHIPTFDRAHT